MFLCSHSFLITVHDRKLRYLIIFLRLKKKSFNFSKIACDIIGREINISVKYYSNLIKKSTSYSLEQYFIKDVIRKSEFAINIKQ